MLTSGFIFYFDTVPPALIHLPRIGTNFQYLYISLALGPISSTYTSLSHGGGGGGGGIDFKKPMYFLLFYILLKCCFMFTIIVVVDFDDRCDSCYYPRAPTWESLLHPVIMTCLHFETGEFNNQLGQYSGVVQWPKISHDSLNWDITS